MARRVDAFLNDWLGVAIRGNKNAACVCSAEQAYEVRRELCHANRIFKPLHFDEVYDSVEFDHAVNLFQHQSAVRVFAPEILAHMYVIYLEQVVALIRARVNSRS